MTGSWVVQCWCGWGIDPTDHGSAVKAAERHEDQLRGGLAEHPASAARDPNAVWVYQNSGAAHVFENPGGVAHCVPNNVWMELPREINPLVFPDRGVSAVSFGPPAGMIG